MSKLLRWYWRWRLDVVEAKIQGRIAAGNSEYLYLSLLYRRGYLVTRLRIAHAPRAVAMRSRGGRGTA